MKNIDKWVSTKYVFKKDRLIGSRNPKDVTVSSRLMTDISASYYQRYVPKYIKGRLADLGCGNVPFYMLYKNLVSEIVCVDWPNSLHKNQYLDIECDLNHPLPIPDSSFDSIILSDVLEHIANPELLWTEMSRILKQKGIILLSVPFFYKIHEAPYDYFRYTEFALKNFAEKNGFKTIEIKSMGGLPEIFTDVIAKNVMKIPLIGSGCSAFVQSMCRFFIRTKFGKRVSSGSGVAYPLGYLMVVEKL